MPYPVIPSNLKNIQSVYLKMMSPNEMSEMSYGEVLTGETINYRTGVPQTNGLFCQAIFGPTKDWECQCGKYKRYRYAGVICDKCGVEVTHSSVRRERMGHISLAAPCVHPWFLRIIPSRVALLLEMKSADISRVCYFSAYIIISINEDMRAEYITRIDQESDARIKGARSTFDKKFEEMSREYQINKSSGKFQNEDLKTKYEADKDILKTQQAELITKIETIAEMARKELIALKVKDVINENIHQELAQKFGPVFKAEIGAEAVETLLKDIDLENEFETLKARIDATKGQAKKKLAKKIKLVKHFLNNETSPAWMILHRVMVLPPDLRPMLQLDGGRFAASDLNDLYRRLINRNNRLRKLIQIGAPEVILRNEKRMLQEAVEALIDNSARNGKQVMASTGIKRPLKSLTDSLKGKGGRFRQNLLGKRVDYSGRSVIIVGPTLKLDECGLPKEMALELFKPFLIGRIISKSEHGVLSEEDQCFNIHSARRLIETKKPIIYDILDEIITDKYVLLNRAPTLHRLGFLAFKPVLIEGKAIQLHPLVCRGFNADFDGDQMAVHLPITIKGQEEARDLMASNKNLLRPANGRLITGGTQDVVLGAYYLTFALPADPDARMKVFASTQEAMIAYNNQHTTTQELIKVLITKDNKSTVVTTTPGRIVFNSCLPSEYEFVNQIIDKKEYEKLLDKIFQRFGQAHLALILDQIKDTTFKYVTFSGISFSCGDLLPSSAKKPLIDSAQTKVAQIQDFYSLGMLSEKDKHRQIISLWRQTGEEVFKLSKEQIFPTSNIGMMVNSSARGNTAQINFMIGMRGITVATNGDEIELPAVHSYLEGLSPLEYFVTMKGHRKGMAGTALQTADAGYLTRRLVDVAQNIVIMADECGTREGITITRANSQTLKKTVIERIYGRYLAEDIIVDGEVIISKGDIIDHEAVAKLQPFEAKIESAVARNPTKCDLSRGVCRKCYGTDLSTHKPVEMGTAVGIIGAQSLGEPSTQLTVSSVKSGVANGAKSDITQGLPRVEELFEARIPKFVAPMSTVNGIVQSIEGSLEQGFKVTIQSNQKQISFELDDSQRHILVKENASIDVGDAIVSSATGEVIHSTLAGRAITTGNQLMIIAEEAKVEELITTPGIYLNITQGQTVICGQPITEGALDLQTLLDLNGIDAVQHYIVQQLNDVYTNNGVDVDEKHIEVIIRQMCSRAQIIDSGETDLLIGDTVRIAVIKTANKKAISEGKKPAVFKRAISGISRSSLATDSFLSAASFQETARVLVEAALSCRKDPLLGLKENVILGQLIPSGTGFDYSRVLTNADVHDEFDEVEAVFAEE